MKRYDDDDMVEVESPLVSECKWARANRRNVLTSVNSSTPFKIHMLVLLRSSDILELASVRLLDTSCRYFAVSTPWLRALEDVTEVGTRASKYATSFSRAY